MTLCDNVVSSVEFSTCKPCGKEHALRTTEFVYILVYIHVRLVSHPHLDFTSSNLGNQSYRACDSSAP